MSKVSKTQTEKRRPAAVLASIRRPHSKNILDGCKELEIRITVPRGIEYPYTVHIYEPLADGGAGAVIGEFTCEGHVGQKGGCLYDMARRAGLTEEQLEKYAAGRMVYGWIVAYPRRYAKPEPLAVYGLKHAPQSWAYVYREGGDDE